MIQISKRLQAVAEQVQSRGVVADIGCDHGFTSIYLIEQKLASRVIAMDINRGPLERAGEHIRQYHMEDRIQCKLSDGAKELVPGEADTLLISGMGGALICKILTDSREVVAEAKELVLSPQSEPFLVRRLVHEMGFCLEREEMLVDQGKYYVILHAIPGRESYSREEEYLYGRKLIREKNQVLLQFLEKEQTRIQGIIKGMSSRKLSAGGWKQKQELEKTLSGILWTIQGIKG